MQRRRFLKAVAAMGVLAAIAPQSLFAVAPAPRLWGDGIHDDTAALQALLDCGQVDLSQGTYRISGTLNLRSYNRIRNCHFRHDADACIRIGSDTHHAMVSHCTFESRPLDSCPLEAV